MLRTAWQTWARSHGSSNVIYSSALTSRVLVLPALLVATTNQGKLREIKAILSGLPYELLTLSDWPGVVTPEENGLTFEENARAKAVHYATATRQLTVAEDSGLEIDALDGAPGIESARWGGVSDTYPRKFAIIYESLRAKGALDSPARFVCALALVRDGE